MYVRANKTKKNTSQASINKTAQKKDDSKNTFHFADNRPETVSQRKLKKITGSNEPGNPVAQLFSNINSALQKKEVEEEEMVQGKFYPSQRQEIEEEEPLQGKFKIVQKKDIEEEEPLQGKFTTLQRQKPEEEELLQGKFESVQKKENNTGLPDNLKSGIENLSGIGMDDVKVHRNSDKPAELQAHAFAQGTDIHVAPGQEKHLPHEAWHVVQQKQGRVRPTTQLKGNVNINDDKGLEKEADVMGTKALQLEKITNYETPNLQEETQLTAHTAQRNVIQLEDINGIDVTNDRGYPKWTQNEKTYHITMISTDSMHVTEEYSRNHYHFAVDAGKVTSKRPKKGEVGGRFSDHHTLDQLPDKAVSDFVKNNITAIMNVK